MSFITSSIKRSEPLGFDQRIAQVGKQRDEKKTAEPAHGAAVAVVGKGMAGSVSEQAISVGAGLSRRHRDGPPAYKGGIKTVRSIPVPTAEPCPICQGLGQVTYVDEEVGCQVSEPCWACTPDPQPRRSAPCARPE